MKRVLIVKILIIAVVSLPRNASWVAAAEAAQAESAGQGLHRTYCNPLPIPDYPVGRQVRTVSNGEPVDDSFGWLLDHKEQFRELADPTALWHEGKWYLYPSVDMAWVSANSGATWEHHPLNIRDVGYAPTVVRHGGRFLLMASQSALYAAESPLGRFRELGQIRLPAGMKVPALIDPMLFSDDDGRLYCYWGCSPVDGIWAVELDASNPTNAIGKPVPVIPFKPDLHPWERVGEWNQNPNSGWLEGSWMLKLGGTYYLTYSAAGTENRTYAMGCYVGKSPLGPFAPQRRNPIFRNTAGLITGTAHGCIVPGPRNELWAFYTLQGGVAHAFERRIGMDPAAVDENGELFIRSATSVPQWLPGSSLRSPQTPDPGWLPLNQRIRTVGSSSAPNLPGLYAVDNELRTWWQPAAGDVRPTLTSDLSAPATIHAVRLLWRDVGLNVNKGIKPGPFRYRVEVETSKDNWVAVVDRSNSATDLLVDYCECAPTVGAKLRLVITGWPAGITPGVAEFTAFGITLAGGR